MGSTWSRIFAVALIFLAAGLIALLRLADKLSSCLLFMFSLLHQFLSESREIEGSRGDGRVLHDRLVECGRFGNADVLMDGSFEDELWAEELLDLPADLLVKILP